jgi:hypothetical protein
MLKYKYDAFVRFTVGCSLIDPPLIDKMVSINKKNMPNIDTTLFQDDYFFSIAFYFLFKKLF